MHSGLMRMGGGSPMFGGSVYRPASSLPEVELSPLARDSVMESIPVHEVDHRTPEQPKTATGFLSTLLTSVNSKDKELLTQRAVLLGEAFELGTRIDAFVSACAGERVARLANKHEEVLARGRELQAVIGECEATFAAAVREFNDANEEQQKRRHDIEEYQQRRRHLSRWATKAEIAAADNRILKSKATMRQALERHTEAMRAYSDADSALASARETLNELAKLEDALRNQAAAMSYRDPYLGLPVQARA